MPRRPHGRQNCNNDRRRAADRERRHTRREPPSARFYTARRSSGGNSLRALKPVAVQHLTPGTVVLTQVKYDNTDGWKTRPAIVLDAGRDQVWVVPLSSSPHRNRPGSYELQYWEQAGLTRPSSAQPKLATVSRATELLDVWGTVDTYDWDAVCAVALAVLPAPHPQAA